MNIEIIHQYINDHNSTYESKYKYLSCYQKSDNVFKFHYYIRDNQLSPISLFIEVSVYDEVSYHFTEDVHEYEKVALVIDCLKHMLKYYGKQNLESKKIRKYLKAPDDTELTSYDIIQLYNYIVYSYGINQKSIDLFYSIYMPHFEDLFKKWQFNQIMEEISMIADAFLYEHFWNGIYSKYLDQQYYLHLYYFRKMADIILSDLNRFVLNTRTQIKELLIHLFEYPRFTICMLSVLDNCKINDNLAGMMINTLSSSYQADKNSRKSLVLNYVNALYYKDEERIENSVIAIFKDILHDIEEISNHDMLVALGSYFLKKYGYDILIEVYQSNYDSHLFTTFSIADIPESYYPKIKEELINGLNYHAKQIKVPANRLVALEQIRQINLIILEFFRDEMYE